MTDPTPSAVYPAPISRNNGLTEHIRLQDQAESLKDLMHGRIIHSPLKSPSLNLDIGCGTGIITRELGRHFPSAQVIGINVASSPKVYAAQDPPNVSFIQGSTHELFRDDARFKAMAGKVDFIFARLLILYMTSWPSFISSAHTLLRVGGYLEIQDTTYELYKHGEVISDRWYHLNRAVAGARELRYDPQCGINVEGHMQYAGFSNIDVQEFNMPFGTWDVPESRRMGAHMVRWQPALFKRMIPILHREIFDGRMREDRRRRLEEQCELWFGAEEGKYRILYVTVGRKGEGRRY